MTLIVPFLWGLLIKEVIKPPELSTLTKKNRAKRKGDFSDNCKNLTGLGDF